MSTRTKCDVGVNNMAKAFNAYVVHARVKHRIYILEDIRIVLMERLLSREEPWRKLIMKFVLEL